MFDHLVAPGSWNVVSFAPPSRTGTISVSYLRPDTLLKNISPPPLGNAISTLKQKTASGSLRLPGLLAAILFCSFDYAFGLGPVIVCVRLIMMNSAGDTGATPISQINMPESTWSGGLVSASHFTKNACSGFP